MCFEKIDVPKKEGKEATTTKLPLRVSQLQIEKIPVSANRDTSKVEETLLSANAEPFNPMAPSMLEWAAAQGERNKCMFPQTFLGISNSMGRARPSPYGIN